jgi:hypothetical protein
MHKAAYVSLLGKHIQFIQNRICFVFTGFITKRRHGKINFACYYLEIKYTVKQ